jgi:porin
MIRSIVATLLGSIALSAAAPALAEEPAPPPAFDISVAYAVDAMSTVSGGSDKAVRLLDNLDVLLDADLERLVGWKGAQFHAHILNNLGAMPNDSAGTLQGVDNMEVPSQRLRLFEAWLEQRLAEGVSLRTGLYDVNSEFYSNEAAGLLIAPAFGIGSEIAATGPNGPSIFPSTALAARLRADIGAGYVQAAVVNANAGVIGDPGGVDFSFDNGVLAIAEGGITAKDGKAKLAVGAWSYSKKQEDIRLLDADGNPISQTAQGAYIVAEVPLTDVNGPHAVSAFVRVGVSDGRTSPYSGGWQTGFLVGEVIPGREDSQLSFGVAKGIINARYRANLADGGVRPARSETQVELTYSDLLFGVLTVQPDIQYVFNPGGDRDAPDAVVVGLRLGIEF